MILAGDIGGTKTNLALFQEQDGKLKLAAEQLYRSKDHAGLEEIIVAFAQSELFQAAKTENIRAACFGVAGPVVNGISKTPNLPWIIAVSNLQQTLTLEKVRLINDLESTAYGIPVLSPDEMITLSEGVPGQVGNGALIAAGTGLGEAALHWEGKDHRPVASEGGHGDFAPRNELEIELLRYLMNRFGHVSYERALSGPGIYNLYCFLRDSHHGNEADWVREKMKTEDPAAVVTQTALSGKDDLCVQALHLFVSIYGAEAGNLALKTMAVNGLYVGGGIAPRIAEKLKDGTFVQSFQDKGRLSALMKSIPVKVILNPKTALLGAARCAGLIA